MGGDQEIGGMISKGEVDGVLFFRDPLSAHPHVDDINALMRICDVHCVATANNPVSGRAVLSDAYADSNISLDFAPGKSSGDNFSLGPRKSLRNVLFAKEPASEEAKGV